MRILSRNEQDLCRRMLDGNGMDNYLSNIIDPQLAGVCISIIRNPQHVDLEFTIQNESPTPEETSKILDRTYEITRDILTAVTLIKMLEREGYIMLIQRATDLPSTSKFGRCIGNMPSIRHHFSDRNIAELLIEYNFKEIEITEEFKRFCDRGFIGRDEQRFRKQISITISALVVAILALLVNTFFNLLPKFTGGSKIKQEQIDTLANGLRSIELSVDSLNTYTLRSSSYIDSCFEQLKRNSSKKKH
jgi:hypothetical protein